MKGYQEVLKNVLVDLREYAPLVEYLEEENNTEHGANAIRLANQTGNPFDNPVPGEDNFSVIVALGVATESSTTRNTAVDRSWRIQVNVGCRQAWRRSLDSDPESFAYLELGKVLDLIGDRLDVAAPGGRPGGTGAAPMPIEEEDGGLTVTKDWIIGHTHMIRSDSG